MSDLKNRKALIVDDSKPIFLMVKEMLDSQGCECTWASHGREACEKLKENDFDFVLLDWNMPEMNGPEFLKENKKKNLTIAPVLMMTTENSPDYIREALELGAAEYIMKPFSKDILISKLEFALKGL